MRARVRRGSWRRTEKETGSTLCKNRDPVGSKESDKEIKLERKEREKQTSSQQP